MNTISTFDDDCLAEKVAPLPTLCDSGIIPEFFKHFLNVRRNLIGLI